MSDTGMKSNEIPKEKNKKGKEESKSVKQEGDDQITHADADSKATDESDVVQGRIDVHTLNYFKRVEKLLSEDSFDDDESKKLFLDNVLAQVGKGLKTCQLARHRLTSTILETLFDMCDAEQFLDLFESLMEDVLTLCRDRFGSHVLQKAVGMILKYVNCHDEEFNLKIEKFFFQLISKVKENLPELVRDVYASHIISTLIQVLAGIRVSDSVARSRNSRMSRGKFFKGGPSKKIGSINFGSLVEKAECPVSDKFKKKLHKVTKRIINDYNFGELLCHKNASSVIQILLLALKETEERSCERLCNMIVEKSRLLRDSNGVEADEASYRVPVLFADEIGSHVMEKIFYVASADLFKAIYTKCFKKSLLQFSLHPLANYIVQHMLSNIPTKEMAVAALEELSPFTEDILASGNMGIVIRMAEMAQRHQCKQKEFLKALMKSVHLPSDKKCRKMIIKLLLTLSTYDVMFEKEAINESENSATEGKESLENESPGGKLTKEAMNYHGACLLKVLFRFQDPKILAKSLLSLNDELLFLIHHEYGSFVVEEFISSSSVSKMHKTSFLLRIKDNIVAMARDKFGSHVVDKLWNNGTDDEKSMIREELYKSRSQLKGNMYGRIVLRNCGLDSFRMPDRSKGQEEVENMPTSKFSEKKTVNQKNEVKKRRNLEAEQSKTDGVAESKKFKSDAAISYKDELQKLASGIRNDDEELLKSKGSKVNVGKESSKEIEELFANKRRKK